MPTPVSTYSTVMTNGSVSLQKDQNGYFYYNTGSGPRQLYDLNNNLLKENNDPNWVAGGYKFVGIRQDSSGNLYLLHFSSTSNTASEWSVNPSTGRYQSHVFGANLTNAEINYKLDLNKDGYIGQPLVNTGTASFSLTGTPAVGQTITAVNTKADPDGNGTFLYQWQSSIDGKDWSNISGANNGTYTVAQTLAGQQIRVQVNYTDGKGFASSTTAAPFTLSNITYSTVMTNGSVSLQKDQNGYFYYNTGSGPRQLYDLNNNLLKENNDPNWVAGGYKFVGIRQDSSSNLYLLQFSRSEKAFSEWRIGPYNSIGNGFSNPNNGKISPSDLFNKNVASLATAESNYNLDLNDDGYIGKPLVNTGSASFSISGIPQVGQTLIAVRTAYDPDGGSDTYDYQWQSSLNGTNWNDISGETKSTYTVNQNQAGQQFRLRVKYTDGKGFQESVVTKSLNPQNTGTAGFSISGTPKVGSLLSVVKTTADPEGDGNGNSTYQWQYSTNAGYSWNNISGENKSSYQVDQSMSTNKIRAIVGYTDSKGFQETAIASPVTLPGVTFYGSRDGFLNGGKRYISGNYSDDYFYAAPNNILTGGGGANTYAFYYGASPITGVDQITDFAFGTDKISLLSSWWSKLDVPATFSRASDNSAAQNLNDLVNAVFTDMDGAKAGNQALGPNQAALVVSTNSAIKGTYLIVNDSNAGFQSGSDLVVNLTGYTGALPGLGSITPSTVFS